jgi:acyl carrier protein
MAQQITTHDALQWVAGLFEEPADRISAATLREAIPAWDSLGILTLMAGLDERFDIRLSAAEIGPLQSVGAILEILSRRGCLSDFPVN